MSYKQIEKVNIDKYLKDLGKYYQRTNGRMYPVDVFLIGGSNILIDYIFRNISGDVDALIKGKSGTFKDAAEKVAYKNGLDRKWLNDDFILTDSYSEKIYEYSKFYKQFGNCVNVYTLKPECVIAMKMRAGREHKNDLSDIVGILAEERSKNNILTKTEIINVYKRLYDTTKLKEVSERVLDLAISSTNIDKLYKQIREAEKANKNLIINKDSQQEVDRILSEKSEINNIGRNGIDLKEHNIQTEEETDDIGKR